MERMVTFDPKIVDSPAEQPAVDYLTGSANGPFIDTGVYAMDRLTGRRLGRIYLSKDTVLSLAQMFDEKPSHGENSAEYSRGYLDGVKDDLGSDLGRVAGALAGFLRYTGALADPTSNR